MPVKPSIRGMSEEASAAYADFIANGNRASGGTVVGESVGSGGYLAVGGANKAYTGKYQLGIGALATAGYIKDPKGLVNDESNWTGKNGISSRNDFLNNPDAQEDAFQAYTNSNLKTGYTIFNNSNGERGISPNDPESKKAGWLAASHLVGPSNADKVGAVDAFNTQASSYKNGAEVAVANATGVPEDEIPSSVATLPEGATDAKKATTTVTENPNEEKEVKVGESKPEPSTAEEPAKPVSVGTVDAQAVRKILGPNVNVLHDYASYNYIFTLYSLTINDMNNASYFTKIPDNTILVRSGGIPNSKVSGIDGTRSRFFNDGDFFFGDVEIDSIMGPNPKTRGTNAISFKFQIIEPIGCTLIERMYSAALESAKVTGATINGENVFPWQTQPFLLSLEFIGNKEDGANSLVVGNQKVIKKFFPIKFVTMSFDIKETGTVYDCEAIVYNHIAFNGSAVSLENNVELRGSNVQEILQDLADNLNAEEKKREGEVIEHGDRYEFEFADDSIKVSPISFDQSKDITKIPFAKKVDFTVGQAIQIPNSSNIVLDSTLKKLSFNKVTNLPEIMNLVLSRCKYVVDQFENKLNSDKQLEYVDEIKWFKITCRVQLGDFDRMRNEYAKTYIYKINKQTVLAPNFSLPTSQTKLPLIVRDYNYLFTGKNQDILNWELKYDFAYFNKLPVKALTDQQSTATKDDKSKDTIKPMPGSSEVVAATNSSSTVPTSAAFQGSGTRSQSKGEIVSGYFMEELFRTNRADLVAITTQIIGDPGYLVQTDVGNNDLNELYQDNEVIIYADGSLNPDNFEILVGMTFKTPTDYDDTTFNYKNAQRSTFSGIYKVIRVKSMFKNGTFLQDVDIIRRTGRKDETILKSINDISHEDASTLVKTPATQQTGRVETQSFPKSDLKVNLNNNDAGVSVHSDLGGLA